MAVISNGDTLRASVGLAWILLAGLAYAQGIPDRNVNIIGVNPPPSLTPELDLVHVPDTGLKQQNEPACAIRPAFPLHILCAFNDYRGVDNPLIGDAWIGYAYTLNGGETWNSDLLPAHSGDSQNSGFAFAADAQVSAAPGVALINYIAADRGDGAEGGLFVHRMFETNRENGAPWVPEMIPVLIASGNAGQFIDKPFQFLHLQPPGSGTVPVNATLKDGTAVSQSVPAGSLLIAYTIFVGNDVNVKTKLMVARSDDYGQSWSTTKLSESQLVNQSASLAAMGDKICAVWRRFDNDRQTDAILGACSADRGRSWSKSYEISANPELFQFDQATTETTFRTNSYPVIASDGLKFYAFWASRLTTSPFLSRIVYSSSADGLSWTTPTMVDNATIGDPPQPLGHQFMPSVAAAGGTLQIAWYDNRNDLFQGPFINDVIDDVVDPSDTGKIIRHPGDLRTAQMTNGVLTPSVQVSRYVHGIPNVDGMPAGDTPVQLEFNFLNDRLFRQGTTPFDGDYTNVAAPAFRLENGEWVANSAAPGPDAAERPVDFFVSWTDNRDVRGNVWENLSDPTVYTPADQTVTAASDDAGFIAPEAGQTGTQVAATGGGSEDHIDVPNNHDALIAKNSSERASDEARADAETDLPGTLFVCVPDGNHRDRTRNQNVYMSVVRPGVSIDSPSASKPTGSIQRAYVIWVSNNTGAPVTYTVSIDNQPDDAPIDGRASFLQVPVAPFAVDDGGLLEAIDIDIDGNSTVARTVFVTSRLPSPPITVSVSDGGGLVLGSITLNPDILTPDIQNPDIQNPDIQNPDIQNAEVHNPDIQNPVITSVQNPDIQNPDIQNPDIQNPDYQNPDIQNPDIQNPDIQNESLDGSSTENPDLENDTLTPEERAAGATDITWEVTNNGNTTTAFNLDAFVNGDTTGLSTQLIATRPQVSETARNCVQGKQVQNQVIFNLINPDLSLFEENTNAGIFGDGSAYVAPNEKIFVTLRVWGDPDFPVDRTGVRVEAQSCNSEDKVEGTTECDPPFDQDGTPVVDQPPVISVPTSLTFQAAGPFGVNINVNNHAHVSDDFDPDPVLMCTAFGGQDVLNVNFTTFPLGVTTVSCTATDSAMNTSEASFTVDVQDTVPPTLIFGDGFKTNFTFETFTTLYNVFFLGELLDIDKQIFAQLHVTTTDAVDTSPALVCLPASGGDQSVFPTIDELNGGGTLVTCTATDFSGNEAVGAFTLSVVIRTVQ